MLGGDKFRNDLSDQFIIKCHVCGNTDLRYVGWERIPVGTVHNPGELSYVCPNGHKTWGAIDDWSTLGGSDDMLQPVVDGCCEGNQCLFPKSIKVNLKGISGVQAREGSNNPAMYYNNTSVYADSLGLDIGTRVAMPWQMCSDYSTVAFYSGMSGTPGEDYIGIGPQSKQRLISFSCGPWSGNGSGIYYSGTPDWTAATMWPWRIPTFVTSGIGSKNFSNFQLYYNKDTGLWDGGDAIKPYGECGCWDNMPTPGTEVTRAGGAYLGPTGYVVPENGEPPYHNPDCTTPDKCLERVFYPPCLSGGVVECFDNDSKYRIPCSNPNDFYIITAGDSYPTQITGKVFGEFSPVFYRTSRCQWALGQLWVVNDLGTSENFPAACSGSEYGWNLLPATTFMNEPINEYEQPHCVRRVKNANMQLVGASYYSVNTADLSDQTIILDRYFRTYGSIDYLWEDNLAFIRNGTGVNDINNYGDVGYNDAVEGRYTPYAWTARSGSLEEPEIVAIIHSENGRHGQIAFDTFPVSYDSDITLDPVYDYFMTKKGTCPYKHKLEVHGYGVKYPLKDDPIWNDESGIYDYPVFLKGKGYKIGDKIEFRAWRMLFDQNGNPIDKNNEAAIESPWWEETKELVIATATITEVTREGGILYYEFDETDPVTGDPLYTIGNNPCTFDLCANPNFQTESYRADGCREWDTNFDKGDCLGCASKEIYPSGHEKIDALPMFRLACNLGSFLPGGKWGDAPNLGCISDADHDYATFCTYLSSGNQPVDMNSLTECDVNCTWTRPCDALSFSDTAGYVVVEYADDCVGSRCYCVYSPDIDSTPDNTGGGGDGEDQYSMIESTGLFGEHEPDDGLFVGQTYPSICRCGAGGPGMPFDEANGSYILPVKNPVAASGYEADHCWPFNRTWEWVSENYARSAMKELPVQSGIRAYIHPYSPQPYIHPPISPQYRISWLPRTQQMVDAHDDWWERAYPLLALSPDKDLLIRNAKMDFLRGAGEGCNILNLDLYDRSYKFPQVDFSQKPHKDRPCRVQDYYQGVGTLFVSYSGGNCNLEQDLVNDDYCKVYGFYQQTTIPCEVVYKGQYIVRAAQKNWRLGPFRDPDAIKAQQPLSTSCEPIIDNLTITLRKREARCEVSLGAPYHQDFLIPENLPSPYIGPDGGLEVAAHPWPTGIASINLNHNIGRTFSHGFHSPRRELYQEWKYIPPSGQENSLPYSLYIPPHPEGYESLREFIPNDANTIKQYLITPTNQMRDVDGYDLITTIDASGDPVIEDLYFPGVWDRPDPRANYRVGTSGLELDDPCPNPATEIWSQVEVTGETFRNSFQFACVYPWEDHVDPANPANANFDFYCMYKNNSAEIVLNTVKECEVCEGQNILFHNSGNYIRSYIPPDYDWGSHYSLKIRFDEQPFEDGDGTEYLDIKYLAFRLYGDIEISEQYLPDFYENLTTFLKFLDEENQSIPEITKEELEDNPVIGRILFDALQIPEYREIFWNLIFQGRHDDSVKGLTKVVIIGLEERTNPLEGQITNVLYVEVLYEEERCAVHRKTGAIESFKVLNGGAGYAFEVEERVPPTELAQIMPGYLIKWGDEAPIRLDYNRRRTETYCLNTSGLVIDPIPGLESIRIPYQVGDKIAISFADSDAKRNGIFFYQIPQIEITAVDSSGVMTDFEIYHSGSFWKYVGTGQHRAFPISMVINNYWNEPEVNEDFTKTGKYAVCTPVVGVDPTRDDYGKIKRIDVDFGGIDYVAPEVYWTIHTSAGVYNNEGDMRSGFDLQHLVDPCKFNIEGSGLNPLDIAAIRRWYAINGIDKYVGTFADSTVPEHPFDGGGRFVGSSLFSGVTVQFPEELNTTNPESYYPDGDSYLRGSKKYYYKTDGNRVIRWQDKVHGWNTIIQSGMCPFGPGGLLDRTYPMALVEEVDLTGESEPTPWRPFTGRCSASQCQEIQNLPSVGVTGQYNDSAYLQTTIVSGAWLCTLMPPWPPTQGGGGGTGESGDPVTTGDLIYDTRLPNPWIFEGGGGYGYGAINDCHWAGCNIYTVYDAHRDPLIYAMPLSNFGITSAYWGGRRRPTMRGCNDEIQVYGDWCSHGVFPEGYVDITDQLAQDRCQTAEYSLYAELAMNWTQVRGPFAVFRSKAITYSMGDGPIEMTVSYNDDTVPEFEPCGTPVCVQTITAYEYITQETHVEAFMTYQQVCEKFCGVGNGCSCDFDCPEGGCSYIITEGECT